MKLLASRLGPNNPECLQLLKPAGFQERKILLDVWLSPDRDFCERYRFICNPGSLFDSILSPHIAHIAEQLSVWSLKSSMWGNQGYFLPKALVNYVIWVLAQSSEFWKLKRAQDPFSYSLMSNFDNRNRKCFRGEKTSTCRLSKASLHLSFIFLYLINFFWLLCCLELPV